MAAEVAQYVTGCKVCQADKNLQSHPAGKLVPWPIPEIALDHVIADRIVGLPKTKKGNTAILVVVDRLIKMTRFGACKDTSTAKDVVHLFMDLVVFPGGGGHLKRTTDRGPEFANKFIAHILARLGTKLHLIIPSLMVRLSA